MAAALAAVAARFCHSDLLWIEEAYGIAAAAEVLRGQNLYRDIWFDKPPLYAWFYALCDASGGQALRVLGAVWVLLCGWASWYLARSWWGVREALLASAFTLIFLTFWIPSAVIAIAPDLLMFVPHAFAVGLAVRGHSTAAGLMSGAAQLCNSKGMFVIAAVLLWAPSRLRAIAGCAAVQGIALIALPAREYWQQVWAWGFLYSSATFVENVWLEGIRRTAGWAWFHSAAVIGAVVCLWRDRDRRLLIWVALACAGVAAGGRFFPRYYFLLLPAIAVAGARGALLLPVRTRILVLGLMLIPVVRFGPRYVTIAMHGSAGWADAAMMEDSRQVSQRLPSACSLLVWGYRPDIYVFSGCTAGTPFLDSQPLTGVIADRHLTDSTVTYPELARANRLALKQTRPEFIADGLGVANPSLAISAYSDLREWLEAYEIVGRTQLSIIYRLRSAPDRLPLRQER